MQAGGDAVSGRQLAGEGGFDARLGNSIRYDSPNFSGFTGSLQWSQQTEAANRNGMVYSMGGYYNNGCLLYTSDAADDLLCVDLGGRRIIKKKKTPRSSNAQKNTSPTLYDSYRKTHHHQNTG